MLALSALVVVISTLFTIKLSSGFSLVTCATMSGFWIALVFGPFPTALLAELVVIAIRILVEVRSILLLTAFSTFPSSCLLALPLTALSALVVIPTVAILVES